MQLLRIAPHRLYFFSGMLAILIMFGWWGYRLPALSAGGLQTHAMLMPLGFFPLFILGFTFTAGPKWLAMPDERRGFVLAGASYLTGVAAQVFSDISGLSWTGLAGSVLMLLAWLGVTLRWAGICGSSAVKDRWHGWVLLFGMMHGTVALFCLMLVRAGLPQYTVLTTALAVFGFLLPVFLNVCHRMLPFFSQNVVQPYQMWKPYWLLATWVVCCELIVIGQGFSLPVMTAIGAASLCLSSMIALYRWQSYRCLNNRLLAMLHYAFVWLPVSAALLLAQASGLHTGSAAVHGFALGLMGTMLIGFVSRVSFGHSGRPLQAPDWLWLVYWAAHFAAALRVLASLLQLTVLMHLSLALWIVCLLVWGFKLFPVYLLPRADGKAG